MSPGRASSLSAAFAVEVHLAGPQVGQRHGAAADSDRAEAAHRAPGRSRRAVTRGSVCRLVSVLHGDRLDDHRRDPVDAVPCRPCARDQIRVRPPGSRRSPVAAPSLAERGFDRPSAATTSSVRPSAVTAEARIVWLIVSPVASAAAMIVGAEHQPDDDQHRARRGGARRCARRAGRTRGCAPPAPRRRPERDHRARRRARRAACPPGCRRARVTVALLDRCCSRRGPRPRRRRSRGPAASGRSSRTSRPAPRRSCGRRPRPRRRTPRRPERQRERLPLGRDEHETPSYPVLLVAARPPPVAEELDGVVEARAHVSISSDCRPAAYIALTSRMLLVDDLAVDHADDAVGGAADARCRG